MALSEKVLNDRLRAQYVSVLKDFFEQNEGAYQVASNTLAIPVVDEEKNEKFIQIVVKVPKGELNEDTNEFEYNGYEEAKNYEHECAEKAKKAEAKEKAKQKKIEHDKALRAQRKAQKEAKAKEG